MAKPSAWLKLLYFLVSEGMDIIEHLNRHLAQVAPHQRDRQQIKLLAESLATIEHLQAALWHIKDHQSIVLNGQGVELSATWNIANNALLDAGIEHLTDNERKI